MMTALTTVVVLLVVVFGMSCTQASTIHMFHLNQESDNPVLADTFDDSTNRLDENEYPVSQDSESMPGRPYPEFRNKYEAQIFKIYDYITNPRDKYIELLSPTSFTFGTVPRGNDSNKVKATLDVDKFKDILEKDTMRNKCTLLIAKIALKRVTDSCDELVNTLGDYLLNGEQMALQNSSGLASEDNQQKKRVILLNIESAKLMLQDLQKILDAYLISSIDTLFVKSVNGVTLDNLILYTASVITSVRGSWIEWKLISYYANNSTANSKY